MRTIITILLLLGSAAAQFAYSPGTLTTPSAPSCDAGTLTLTAPEAALVCYTSSAGTPSAPAGSLPSTCSSGSSLTLSGSGASRGGTISGIGSTTNYKFISYSPFWVPSSVYSKTCTIGGGGTISHVAGVAAAGYGYKTANTALTVAMAGSGIAHTNDVLVVCAATGTYNDTLTVSDTKTNTWTQAVTNSASGTPGQVKCWTAIANGTGADTISVTDTTQDNNIYAVVDSFTANLTSSYVDKTAGANDYDNTCNGTSCTLPATGTLSQANEAVVAATYVDNYSTYITAGSGFALSGQSNSGGGGHQFAMEYKIVSATTSVPADWVGNDMTGTWNSVIFTIKSQ